MMRRIHMLRSNIVRDDDISKVSNAILCHFLSILGLFFSRSRLDPDHSMVRLSPKLMDYALSIEHEFFFFVTSRYLLDRYNHTIDWRFVLQTQILTTTAAAAPK